MPVKRYSSKEPIIFVWFMLPYMVIMNMLLLGNCVFSSLKNFLVSFVVSATYFALIYGVFGMVAVIIKKRVPSDDQLFKRISIMLPMFYLMNLLAVQGIYVVYEQIKWVSCTPLQSMEWWVTGFACLASTIITFVNEAADGWEKWKRSIQETRLLETTYQRSRLLGLKQQINPHFLFNCFNTLSSLINEDEKEAEKFLDEMTKVHRYMLRGSDEQFVSLEAELNFARSYLYLTKARFGDAIQLVIDIKDEDLGKTIPPLSLQVILENIIYNNAAGKNNPLEIQISSSEGNKLVIRNSVHPKTRQTPVDYEEGIDNLVEKYKLLNQPPVEVIETATHREVYLPLIAKEEVTP